MSELTKSKPVTVRRIAVPRSYDVLADHLRETILAGEIAEGESLPTERELVVQTGLSRGSVREALRMLAVEGLVRTRPGRSGGNVVTLPGNDSMTNAIDRFVRGRKLPLRTIQETREFLEPALARLAAQRRTEENIRKLKSLHDELITSADNFQSFALINIKWHNAVAEASGNELLAALLHSISHGVAIATTTEEYDTTDTRKAVIRVHSKINEAIELQDADLAERRMRQHIGATLTRAKTPSSLNIPL